MKASWMGVCWGVGLLVSNGCADKVQPPEFSTTDSAGITISISRSPDWETGTDGWLVGSAPVLVLGKPAASSDYEFYRVADATRLEDGSIAVANAGTHEIRRFSSDGTFLNAVGREGEGPGEFGRILGMEVIRGDSVLVHSTRTRITVLDPLLKVARSFEVDRRVSDVQTLDARSLLAVLTPEPWRRRDRFRTVLREGVPLLRLDIADGTVMDTVGVAEGNEEVWFPWDTGMYGVGTMFGHTLAIDAGDGLMVTGGGKKMELEIRDSGGSLQRLVRVPRYPLGLVEEEIDEERRAWLGKEPSPLDREMVNQMPAVSDRPAYERVLLDDLGYIWAAEYQGMADRREAQAWEVFDPRGRWLGPVEVPPMFEVFEIGPDYILGVQVDELGVESVRVIELRR